MSRYHGEQYWQEIRHQARNGWRELTDDDLDTIDEMRRDREVRTRDQRTRSRRSRSLDGRETEL